MKPGIGKDYASLCSQQIPFTDHMFGDDLRKQLKDIGDVNTIGAKVQASRGTQRRDQQIKLDIDITLVEGALFLTTGLKKTSKVRPTDLGGTKSFKTKQQASVTVAQASASHKVNVPKFVAGNLQS